MRLRIRARLTLVSAALMTVVLVGLAVFLYVRLEVDLVAAVDAGLRSRASVLEERIGEGGGVSGSGISEADEAFAQVLSPDGRLIATSANVTAPMVDPGEVSDAGGVAFLEKRVATVEEPVEARLLVTTTSGGELLVVGAALEDQRDALTGLASLLLVGILAAVALTALVGWVVAGAALRPVDRMRREADAISASEPGRRLADPGTGDEPRRTGRRPRSDACAPGGSGRAGAPLRCRCQPRASHAARQPPHGGGSRPPARADAGGAGGCAVERARRDRSARPARGGPTGPCPLLRGPRAAASRDGRYRRPGGRDSRGLRRTCRVARGRGVHRGRRGHERVRRPDPHRPGGGQSRRQRASPHAAGRSRAGLRARRRRRGRTSRWPTPARGSARSSSRASGSGSAGPMSRAGEQRAAPDSDWRSCAPSSRRTAGALRPRTWRAAARGSRSRCPPRPPELSSAIHRPLMVGPAP